MPLVIMQLWPAQWASLFVVATLWGSARSGGQGRSIDDGMRDRFIGAWRLASVEEADADGSVHRADCTGILVFTREGYMSVQVMYRNPQTGTPSGPVQYAQGGYEASFGRYEIDERVHRFTYHVEGALVRSLIGKELTRLFELSGTQLIVMSSRDGWVGWPWGPARSSVVSACVRAAAAPRARARLRGRAGASGTRRNIAR
jgi:hypothetical protein